jgi:O-antigen ligase
MGYSQDYVVFLPPFVFAKSLISMEISKLRRYLLDRGIVQIYSLFVAGYFLLPMASGHRQLYYVLICPAVLLLARELRTFYAGNRLAGLVLLYVGYMMASLAWTADFVAQEAIWQLGYSLTLLTFIFISGYLWIQYPQRLRVLMPRLIWLAGAAALVSIVVWYSNNPFPASRLEPLGVMHHQNKSACAYGILLMLCIHYFIYPKAQPQRAVGIAIALVLLALILFTQSRTALAGVSIALLVMLGYRALIVVIAGLGLSFALISNNPTDWWFRVENFSFRPGIWQQLLTEMDGHWLFGRGYLVNPKVEVYDYTFNHAHNGYLASLRDGGLIGLLLLLAILLTSGLWALRLYRQRQQRLYLALLLYGMTVISLDFDRLLVHPKELWLFFWLPIALIMATYAHQQRETPL